MSNLDTRLREAIIYSAKHVGVWDEKMSDRVRSGERHNVFLDTTSLIRATKQAFIDEGWVSDDTAKSTVMEHKFYEVAQDVANLHANMKQDMLRLGLTPTPPTYAGPDAFPLNVNRTPEELKAIGEELSKPRLTGQEWYERFEKEIGDDAIGFLGYWRFHKAFEAAKKAAGLEGGDG